MEYLNLFKSLGLSQNEAKIYEALLHAGQTSVRKISEITNIHRRNIYDAMNRLQERGLVYELIETSENLYSPAEPSRLRELASEKLSAIDQALPNLDKIFFTNPSEYKVLTYRGEEGWKQYMKDLLKIGQPFYSIAAQGAWLDERVKAFVPGFLEQIKKRKITLNHLFDHEVKENNHPILKHVGKNYRFLPKKYATSSGIDIFGDRVNIMHHQYLGKVGTAHEITFTVIVNQNLADSFRTWFKFMWDLSPKN